MESALKKTGAVLSMRNYIVLSDFSGSSFSPTGAASWPLLGSNRTYTRPAQSQAAMRMTSLLFATEHQACSGFDLILPDLREKPTRACMFTLPLRVTKQLAL